MKKFVCLLICLLCVPSLCVAEVEIGAMSFDELIELREKVIAEIITRPEWNCVTVPAGVYEIGVDIPAGHWTITPVNDSVAFNYGAVLNSTKTNIELLNITATGGAAKAGTFMSDFFGMESVSIYLEDGNWLYLDNPSVFSIYVRPALGF